MNKSLQAADRIALRKHEQAIERTKTAFVECGQHLAAIRDGKLYRDEFDTFEQYCQERWGWGRRYANHLIESSEIVKELPTSMGTMVPKERVARALKNVPPSDRPRVLAEVAKTGPVTAKRIEQAAGGNGEKPVIELDEIGQPIPDTILGDWRRAEETGKRLRSMASDIKCSLKNGLAEHDIIYRELLNTVVTDAGALFTVLGQIIPFAVCPVCRGHQRKGCQRCKQRGFVSKFSYDSFTDSETKKLLETK